MEAGDYPVPETLPVVIGVRGARHNNLRDVDIDVPLWRTVAVVGVSGSGKTSLAMGTLYAEGLHRFLEGVRAAPGPRSSSSTTTWTCSRSACLSRTPDHQNRMEGTPDMATAVGPALSYTSAPGAVGAGDHRAGLGDRGA